MSDESTGVPRLNITGPINSWDLSSQVGLEDFENNKDCLKTPGSPSDGLVSSITDLDDNGDEAQLRTCRPSRGRGRSKPRSSTVRFDLAPADDVVQGMERGMEPRTEDEMEHDIKDIIEATSSMHQGTAAELLDIPDETDDFGWTLAYKIRAAYVPIPDDEDNSFLPFGDLEGLITEDIIRQVLQAENCITNLTEEKLSKIVEETWSMSSVPNQEASVCPHERCRDDSRLGSHKTSGTSRRKLFAILARLQRASDIEGFIEEGIYDYHLPFTIQSIGNSLIITRTSSHGPKPIDLFSCKGPRRWRDVDKESFIRDQWKMTSPFFRMSGDKCHNIKLNDKDILPFVERSDVKADGGFGEVRKVKIHPEHHDYVFRDDEPGYFAVKKLYHTDNGLERFQKEVSNLKRVRNDPNIISLLVSYQWQGGYYLVFPWAEGDLCDFWKEYPNGPVNKSDDASVPQWLIEQCLALAQGLEAINRPDKRDEKALSPDRGESGKHGRHGDVKPHNILWFKSIFSGLGHFKIADLGLSEFHRTQSMRDDPHETARTRTFRAPEMNAADSVGPEYDLWSLGCVLLLHLGWYIRGQEHLEAFENARFNDAKTFPTPVDHESMLEDNFFTYERFERNGEDMKRATMKKSVILELDSLRQDPTSSDLVVDVLNIIQFNLLRMDFKNRLPMAKVVEKFESLRNNCLNSPDYGLKRTMKTDRTPTGLSSITSPSYTVLPIRDSEPTSHSRSSSSRVTAIFPSIASVFPTQGLRRHSSEPHRKNHVHVPSLMREVTSGLTAVADSPAMAVIDHQQSQHARISTEPDNTPHLTSETTRVDDDTENMSTIPPLKQPDMHTGLLASEAGGGYGSVYHENATKVRTDRHDLDGDSTGCISFSCIGRILGCY